MADKYYEFDETTKILGVSDDELLDMASNNVIKAYRVGRDTKFKRDEVDQYAAEHPAGAAPAADTPGDSSADDDLQMLEDDDNNSEQSITLEMAPTEEPPLATAGEQTENADEKTDAEPLAVEADSDIVELDSLDDAETQPQSADTAPAPEENIPQPEKDEEIIELDDLPDDIELVEDTPTAPEQASENAEEAAAMAAGETPADITDDELMFSEDELAVEESANPATQGTAAENDIPIIEEPLPEEEISLTEAADDMALIDDATSLSQEEVASEDNLEISAEASDLPPVDEPAGLDLADAEAEPGIEIVTGDDAEAELTEITDEAAIADDSIPDEEIEIIAEENADGEEIDTDSATIEVSNEINANDLEAVTSEVDTVNEDASFNTQEVTLQEDAISEDEIASDDNEKNISADNEEFTEDLSAGIAKHAPSKRFSGMKRASLQTDDDVDDDAQPKNTLWNVLLAAMVVLMIYPAFLLLHVYVFDVCDTRSFLNIGEQKFIETRRGQPPLKNVGEPAIPDMFKWVDKKEVYAGKKFCQLFGTRKTEVGGKTGLDMFMNYEDRVKNNMIFERAEKAPQPANEEAAEKKEEGADNADDKKDKDESVEANKEEKAEEKAEEKKEEKAEENAEEKKEEKAEENAEEKKEEKAEEKAEEKKEEKAEEKAEEKKEEPAEEKKEEKKEE